MFATLLGALPHPPLNDVTTDAAEDAAEVVRARVEAQQDAGLEPLTDGGGPRLSGAAEAWMAASDHAGTIAVKQALVGPWTRHAGHGRRSLADGVREVVQELRALVEVGCPLVEVHEPAVVGRSFDRVERGALIEAWRAVIGEGGGDEGVHAALVLTGGDVTALGASIYEAPFASYAFDLRNGPDNWRVIAVAPKERGIVVGAMSTAPRSDDGPELLAWAAHYAASTAGRGLDRVGLATAGSLAHLSWDAAVRKLQRLARAAEIAARPTFRDMAPDLDPRAAGLKSAALGRYVPPARRARRGGE